jgi:hypothetical protein
MSEIIIKPKRVFVSETIGDLKKCIMNLPNDLMLTAGEPYNFVLLEEFTDKKKKRNFIKVSEYNGEDYVSDYWEEDKKDKDGWYKIQ